MDPGWKIEIITTAFGGTYYANWTQPGGGKPPACTVYNIVQVGQTIEFPADFAGISGTVGTNPTGTATFGVDVVGRTGYRHLGVFRISNTGVFTGDTGGVAVTIYPGDTLSVYTPCPQNATLADVTVTLVGTIVGGAGSDFAFNGLYLQWGAGPSSFGGVGYDYRYTYYNINTGTESNGSQIQNSSQQFGTASSLGSLIVLRQGIGISGMYSADPQVTHVRIYRRGGYLGDNWRLVDQIPNILGSGFGFFDYEDIIPDKSLVQANTLALDNDVPVTSSLINPISTTLAAPVGGAGGNVYDLFGPTLITVTDASAQFLLNQILVIGTPQNLEQVPVYIAGTGACYVTLRLQHDAGEPVLAFSIPAQPVDLVALAYGQMWWAGDPNNPHFLYYSKPGYPENAGPQNYIQVSEPSDPITVVVNFRGTLFVSTLTTWYQIVGGPTPYAQPTGSKHGCVAKHGWTQTESAIWFQAIDGIREFRGADGAYRTLPIEWLYRQEAQSLSPVPFVDLDKLNEVVLAFQNNYVYVLYPVRGFGGTSRIVYSTVYNRWRNDTVAATTMFYEADTNLLLYSKYISGPTGPGYAVCEDRVGDTDDLGWNAFHTLSSSDININVQTPYQDLGKPHFTKQWNMLEVDADANDGVLTVYGVFENFGIVFLGQLDLVGRQKYQLPINHGFGIEAYRMGVMITGYGLLGPPNLYQLDVYAAVLAANRSTWDSYWIKFGTDESKLIKEGYFDYTSTEAIDCSLFADGSTTPYYFFTLPANPTRSSVPMRVRFPAVKCRLWRCVCISTPDNTHNFQFWANPQVSWKPTAAGAGYARVELNV